MSVRVIVKPNDDVCVTCSGFGFVVSMMLIRGICWHWHNIRNTDEKNLVLRQIEIYFPGNLHMIKVFRK